MINTSLRNQNKFFRVASSIPAKKSLLIELISFLFIILFLYTGIAKLMDFSLFIEQLRESPILKPIAPVVAWGLPVVEFIVASFLFYTPWRLIGLYAAFGLMLIFTLYVTIVLTTSPQLPCSCGGIIELLSWPAHLVVNIILTGLAFIAIKLLKRTGTFIETL